jgi:hypothetical protein
VCSAVRHGGQTSVGVGARASGGMYESLTRLSSADRGGIETRASRKLHGRGILQPILCGLHRLIGMVDGASARKLLRQEGEQEHPEPARPPLARVRRCRRRFLDFFPRGFADPDYVESERSYKWDTHLRWMEVLDSAEFRRLVRNHEFAEVASRAIRVEQSSTYSMLFSFEKMALRDAVKTREGAQLFADGLDYFLHGRGLLENRFEAWVKVVDSLPRKQTRVLTWPVVTVFGFIAQPDTHFFFKPKVTRKAAADYGFDLPYSSRPSWETYASLLELAKILRRDLKDLKPRDMIDIQSFLWVVGSEEYD